MSAGIDPRISIALETHEEASRRITELQQEIFEVGRKRAEAVALMYDCGLSYAKIGFKLGLSAARVQQIVATLARPDTNPNQHDDRATIEELIEASSLGTPEAKAIRDSVPVERAREVVRRSREVTRR